MTYSISGFSEAVFIVNDLAHSKNVYCQHLDWQLLSEGTITNEQLQSWQLPSHCNGAHCLLKEPGSTGGYIRLVQLNNVAQVSIRGNSQAWDTGGFFDVNARVKGSFKLANKLNKLGWFGINEPVNMQFGPFKVFEWFSKSHDGIVHALIERIEPPLENDNQQGVISRLINASMIVKDHQQERHFIETVLGFECLLYQKDSFKEAGTNVFGLPYELANKEPHELSLLSPDGTRNGTVELASFPGLSGNDYSHNAKAPNLGVVSLRFEVSKMNEFLAHLHHHNVTPLTLTQMNLAPYGEITLAVIITPEGNQFEFYQIAEKTEQQESL